MKYNLFLKNIYKKKKQPTTLSSLWNFNLSSYSAVLKHSALQN